MLDQLKARLSGHEPDGSDQSEDAGLPSLRLLAAELLLVTGFGATLDVIARTREAQRDRIPGRDGLARLPIAAVWGPALLAPVAATAHLRQATAPGETSARAANFLDSAVVGLGLLELATTLTGAGRRPRVPSLVPLAFASAGLLGLLVSRREEEIEREREHLSRRADVVERLVPRRKAKLDRIVVHV